MTYLSPREQQERIVAFVRDQDEPIDRVTIAHHLGYQTPNAIHRSLKKLVNIAILLELSFQRTNGTWKHYYIFNDHGVEGWHVANQVVQEIFQNPHLYTPSED